MNKKIIFFIMSGILLLIILKLIPSTDNNQAPLKSNQTENVSSNLKTDLNQIQNKFPTIQKEDKLNYFDVSVFKKNIKSAFSNNDIYQLDNLVKSFLASTQISKNEKIDILWSLLQSSNKDFNFRYLADALSTLNPIGLSPEVINFYKEVSNEKKISLLNLLVSTLLIKEKIEGKPNDYLRRIAEQQQDGKDFLRSTLYSETNSELFDAIFKSYLTVASPQEIITDINQIFTNDKKTSFSKSSLTSIILKNTFLDKDLQDSFLPELLSNNSHEEEGEFDDNINFWVKKLGKESLSPQAITSLRERTEKNIQFFNTEKLIDNAIEGVKFMNNLEAVATLSTDSTVSKEYAIVDYSINNFILNETKPLKMAIAVALADNNTTSLFKKRKNDIIPTLSDALNANSFSTQAELIKDAINILNEE